MTLSKNQKKSINKKCSSFKGESKSKCIANAKCEKHLETD